MQRPQRIPPGPGQESVWEYPRPPRLEASSKRLQVVVAGVTGAETTRAFRVLETSHSPTWYFPPEDVRADLLEPACGQSWCEWKGHAEYVSLSVDARRVARVGWTYPNPTPEFRAIAQFIAFYPSLVDACYVDGEPVEPQPGGFYGGWITSDVVGPFKGEPATQGW
ncbi:hypothetical protein Mal4_44130 [Maioricimonas rarisocia]|uniref:DUF427 domain-containing protein n=1 Tax=Maioricimonas rarisocia TaxID=2528026 RepID=A0A517ZC81_9PLAN|nr:DUF427 domain-containing protein [Maioricimonas rarisocia]QDU40059.1 hypothetical protein Mal4_44130 [Maioricimonas rarisocia]